MANNEYYGIASGVSDFVGGMDAESDRQAKKSQQKQAGQFSDLKMDKIRGEMEKENSKAALQSLIMGDTEGAMEKYNSKGDDKMTELQLNPDTGMVTWTDGKGSEQVAMLPQLMAMSGLDPRQLDTPDKKLGRDKDLATHKAQLSKKYGISGGSSKVPADIQRHKYYMKTLTGGDPQKAFKLMQLSKTSPDAAYSRILLGLQKQNKDAFDDEKMSEEQMRETAKESVKAFRDDMFNELFQQEETGVAAPAQNNKDPLGIL